MKTISIQVIGRVQGVYFRAFTQKKVTQIRAYSAVDNSASAKILQKTGFRVVKTVDSDEGPKTLWISMALPQI